MIADQLSYHDMALDNSGSIMSKETKEELRKQHGYCTTCPGIPTLLVDLHRSKLNPLWLTKKPRTVPGECVQGKCVRCHPSLQPGKTTSKARGRTTSRSSSFQSIGSTMTSTSVSSSTSSQLSLSTASKPTRSGDHGSLCSLVSSRESSISTLRSCHSTSKQSLDSGSSHSHKSWSSATMDTTATMDYVVPAEVSGNAMANVTSTVSSQRDGGSGPSLGNRRSLMAHPTTDQAISRRVQPSSSSLASSRAGDGVRELNNSRHNVEGVPPATVTQATSPTSNEMPPRTSARATPQDQQDGSNTPASVLPGEVIKREPIRRSPIYTTPMKVQSFKVSAADPPPGPPRRGSSLNGIDETKVSTEVITQDAPSSPPLPKRAHSEECGGKISSLEDLGVDQPTPRRASSLSDAAACETQTLPPPTTERANIHKTPASAQIQQSSESDDADASIPAEVETSGSSVPSSSASTGRKPRSTVQRTLTMPASSAVEIQPETRRGTSLSSSDAFQGSGSNLLASGQDPEEDDSAVVGDIKAFVEAMRQEGDVGLMTEILLSSMESHQANESVQLYCLEVMAELFRDTTTERPELVSGILRAMKDFPSSFQVQKIGCEVIGCLASSEGCCTILVRAGACESLVRSMTQQGNNNVELVASVVATLRMLSATTEARDALRCQEGDVSGQVSKAMEFHPTSTDVQRDGCALLSNISIDLEKRKVSPVSSEVLDAVMKALKEHTSDSTVVSSACFALKNFTFDESNSRRLRSVDGIFDLLHRVSGVCEDPFVVMERLQVSMAEDESLEEQALASIKSLVEFRSSEDIAGVITDSLATMTTFSWSPRVTARCLQVLKSLAESSDAHKNAIREKIVSSRIKQQIEEHASDVGVQGAARMLMHVVDGGETGKMIM